ncbi:DMT family transporter [Corallincola luteus]|uniref:DMT family transporter n=2 Tax=Corallincola TaxID=1775176 RepID=A0A368NTN6_9GAMM|nr:MULTISPECIES: DMT family transporter [Corallincola]RCU52859.1 DMT family transporter [Corallincola holothuriorum]TCI03358.1 DMT family transporter [Corallincola luteus]
MVAFTGEIAALTAALFWAIATWIYSHCSQRFGAMPLNVIKGVIASLLLLIALLLSDASVGIPSGSAWGWLIISGVIGIAIGDTAYFAALRRMGPRKVLLMESLAPPLTGVLALLVLNEAITVTAALGMLVTLTGVIYVLRQQSHDDNEPSICKKGLFYGALAAVCQAVGVLLSHYALVDADVAPLWGALIRLVAGTLVIALLLGLRQEIHKQLIKPLLAMDMRNGAILTVAIVVGTFLAIWLQQVSLKYANAAVAQTLMATSPLFALPIAWLRGNPPTFKIWLGTLSAVAGIAMIMFG